ncbi:UNVERIFIED_CONTAM: hypothetical protein PYX00_011678 [Menopon gallinae]|uniref:60S acidic ribosomal protein P1 n=1 Tax=Menopon gallinae TaxID=328185 RepID=A0AAW2H8B5_9NEOP
MMTNESKTMEVYSKAALFINACNMEARLAELFEIPPHKLNEMMMSVSAAPTVAAVQPAAVQETAAKDAASAKDAKKEVPVEEEEEDIDFGDMFG